MSFILTDFSYRKIAQTIKKPTLLYFFDFDGTLFRTPEKPDWWTEKGWWQNPKSLKSPQVPEEPDKSWWISSTVNDAKAAYGDPNVFSALVTAKYGSKFKKRINDLLSQRGIEFDEVRFAPDGSVGKWWKPRMLRQLINDVKPDRVEIWEDRAENAEAFKEVCEDKDLPCKVHMVKEESKKALQPKKSYLQGYQ